MTRVSETPTPTAHDLCRAIDDITFSRRLDALLAQLTRRIDAMDPDQAARLLPLLEALAFSAPVRSKQVICTDRCNPERYGTPYGMAYYCGDGADEVELFIDVDGSEPEVYMFGREALALADLERVLPHLLALLFNPQVQQAQAEQL